MTPLESLVAPCSLDEFFADFWGQQFRLFRSVEKSALPEFSFPDFLRLVSSADLATDHFRACEHGRISSASMRHLLNSIHEWQEVPTLDSLSAALGGTSTLVFDDIQTRHAALRAWTLSLARQLTALTVVNAYFTPAFAPSGLGLHYDNQEIFILQVHGSKRWEIYPTPEKYPLKASEAGAEPTDVAGLHQSVDLREGDVLYLPKGLWHRPVTMDEPSLHLTVTIVCNNIGSLGNWVIDELSSEEHLRRDFPLAISGEAGDVDFALERAAAGMSGILASDDWKRRYKMAAAAHALKRGAKKSTE